MKRRNTTAPTLVLLHAFPFTSAMWEPQRPLGDHLPLYAPDLPGFGGESRPDGELFSMALAARFIQHELDARDIERTILCGLSMGGYIAFECWRLFPERIAGLILADTKAAADTEEGRTKRYDAVERIGAGGYASYVDDLLGDLLTEKTRAGNPGMVDTVRAIAASVLPESAIAGLLGMAARADSTDLLPSITVPAALIFGEQDNPTPVEEGRRMAERLPGATLTTIPDAAHLSNIERPGAFNRAVMELMERVMMNDRRGDGG